jgi:IS30 family transposase
VRGAEELAAAVAALNVRPRKSLDSRAPAEAFGEALQSAQGRVATIG